MIEVLQFLFATEKDQLLYLNQDTLVRELVTEYNFSEQEVRQALAWFAPIADECTTLEINPDSIRSLSNWEEQYLPKEVVTHILELASSKSISNVEREILFDRIGELFLEWPLVNDEASEILDGLVSHLQNYRPGLIKFDLPESPWYWAANCTIH
ncbi:MAG: DUF494 family protein [Proteobacteria bacterium]|nr:MAG: DUF494 family protein [Pseudomonadota bacterium]